jgi:ligand-binding sensor domain-containing protein/signal transduction histidine kinase
MEDRIAPQALKHYNIRVTAFRGNCIFLIAAAISPSLRSELLPVRTYTALDGLASDRVSCIVPDSRGFLWFCTPEGLSRFDGYRFLSYTKAEGLADNLVTTVLETPSGNLFVGTAHGISRVNSSHSATAFTTFYPEPEVGENYIAALIESRAGTIWCATRRSIYAWDGAGAFRRREIRLANSGEQILSLAEDRQGVLWIGSNNAVYALRDSAFAWSFGQEDGLPGDLVSSLVLDSKGRMWAAARNGVALFEQAVEGGWKLARTYTKHSGLAGNGATALAESADGSLWVATDGGISRIDLKGSQPGAPANAGREQGLSDRQINAVAEDPAGNLWAGTGGAGAMRIDRLGFRTYREQDGLPTDRVFSVMESRAGELIATTVTGRQARSVSIFDGARFRSIDFPVFDGHASWVTDRILLQSRSGEWWAATTQGLCQFPAAPAAGLRGMRPKTCYAPQTTILRAFEDSKGRIWASAQSERGIGRLIRWDPETDSASTLLDDPLGGLVEAFAEDRQGRVWIGMTRGGVYRYDNGAFRYFGGADVPTGAIHALLALGNELWMGSAGGGLARIEDTSAERPRIEIYGTARGLASNIVTCLVEDPAGYIYAGTGRGVDRIDPKTGHIRHFSTANGLGHGTITSGWRDRSGSLWFATSQGLSKLTPAPDRPAIRPRILITDLRIGGASYPLSQLGAARISKLELDVSQNHLQVDFAGIDYGPGDLLRYSYKLEGADTDWGPPRAQHSVNYAALESGSYRFFVKAIDPDGAESPTPAEIDFTVLPPLWKRWWFQTLAFTFLAAAALAAHRYRVAQAVNLERVRTAIATDLHDDIGAGLSQIAILTEVARVRGRESSSDPLERAAALARELIDSMSDIVWSIRADPGGADSLVRRMREFGIDLLGSQGIAFELRANSSPKGLSASIHARRQLFLMFKECIHNAARHSQATEVTADLSVENREVVLTVEDNGVGLTAKKSEGIRGTGIEGMRRRAASLGGSVQVSSSPECGYCVTIRFPAGQGAFS